MSTEPLVLLNLVEALGIGLLIGAERERRATIGGGPAPAGIRTFAISSLVGAASVLVGGDALLVTVLAGTFALAGVGYWKANGANIGLTTGIALVMTVLLGGLSIRRPEVAAGLGVVVAILLAARAKLQTFVRSAITEDELRDALVLAAATLVILPVVPDRYIDPYGILNPYKIWILVVLVMVIGAAGHIAIRLMGANFGLPLVGLASGFISSTATIRDMAHRASKQPDLLLAAVSGASLSSIATVVLMAAILAATSPATLSQVAIPLMAAGCFAVVYGLLSTVTALRSVGDAAHELKQSKAFSIKTAIVFSLTLTSVIAASVIIQEAVGSTGVILAAGLAGLVNTQAVAISVALLVGSGKLGPNDAILPILAAISTNTAVKVLIAHSGGGRAFSLRVVPGLILTCLSAWIGFLMMRV